MSHWSQQFVGLPWRPGGRDKSGVDCYGLIALAYRHVARIELDPLNGLYATAEEREDIAAIVAGEAARGPWVIIPEGLERELDVLLFRCAGLQSHAGVAAGRGLMLHATAGQPSGIVRYRDGKWRPRFCGAFRHRSLA